MSRDIDIESFEDALVRNCSPTLAGLKPAALFTYPGAYMDKEAGPLDTPSAEIAERRSRLLDLVAEAQARLAATGLQIRVLVWRTCGALVYVYQPQKLATYLADERAVSRLEPMGYDLTSIDASIAYLAARISLAGKKASALAATHAEHCTLAPSCAEPCPCEFPHEMGFFLGYPYDDVIGFIENHGENFLAFGAWKVYTNLPQALETFALYKHCTERFTSVYRRKRNLSQVLCGQR